MLDFISYRIKSYFQKRTFYEGAKRTKANRDFYNANQPFEETARLDRDTLRMRARWLSSNNPIMSNIDNSIINNVVGKGIGVLSKTGDKKIDDIIEKRFKTWCRKENCDITGGSSFFEIQKLVLNSRMVDGEIFIYKKITKDGLKLQIIESDLIDANKGTNGITVDENGKPTKYHFLTIDNKSIEIKAENIINYFKKERPTQYRGISEYKQAIIDIKNFSAYQSSTVKSARANAEIAYTVETERPNSSFGSAYDSTSDEEIQDINGLMVYYLKAGEKIEKHENKHNGSGYSEFITSTIRTISVARKISYELAFRDYSHVNFASSRASLIQDNKRFDDEQSHIKEHFLIDVFDEWLSTEVSLGNIPISPIQYFLDKEKYSNPYFSFPKREWVDPLKTLKASELEINLNLTTESDECATTGRDYEDILKTKQKEKELRAKYGILNAQDIKELELKK